MFYRQFNALVQDIIVIGCGGTGSRIIPPLIQLIKTARTAINPALYLIDGDIVESKNLTRQNFIEPDIGRNKAEVLAERYGTALDFPVMALPEMIQGSGTVCAKLKTRARAIGFREPTATRKIVIMCVDSIDARLTIMKKLPADAIIIDAGNEDTFGQVQIYDLFAPEYLSGSTGNKLDIQPFLGECALPFIPAPIEQYMEAKRNPPVANGSCADLDQSLAINFMMAAGIINMVQNLVYNNKFYFRTNYFDLHQGNSTEKMTPAWLNEQYARRNVDITSDNCFMADYSSNASDRSNLSSHISNHMSQLSRVIGEQVQFVDPAILAAIGRG